MQPSPTADTLNPLAPNSLSFILAYPMLFYYTANGSPFVDGRITDFLTNITDTRHKLDFEIESAIIGERGEN